MMMMSTIITTTITAMIAPTITGVDESEEVMLTWMGDVMLVAFSIGISGVTPLVAVTVMVYCAPGFRPATILIIASTELHRPGVNDHTSFSKHSAHKFTVGGSPPPPSPCSCAYHVACQHQCAWFCLM